MLVLELLRTLQMFPSMAASKNLQGDETDMVNMCQSRTPLGLLEDKRCWLVLTGWAAGVSQAGLGATRRRRPCAV